MTSALVLLLVMVCIGLAAPRLDRRLSFALTAGAIVIYMTYAYLTG